MRINISEHLVPYDNSTMTVAYFLILVSAFTFAAATLIEPVFNIIGTGLVTTAATGIVFTCVSSVSANAESFVDIFYGYLHSENVSDYILFQVYTYMSEYLRGIRLLYHMFSMFVEFLGDINSPLHAQGLEIQQHFHTALVNLFNIFRHLVGLLHIASPSIPLNEIDIV